MASGGQRKGAGNKPLPFKTKYVVTTIKGSDYERLKLEGETYDQFYDRVKTPMKKAFKEILKNISTF